MNSDGRDKEPLKTASGASDPLTSRPNEVAAQPTIDAPPEKSGDLSASAAVSAIDPANPPYATEIDSGKKTAKASFLQRLANRIRHHPLVVILEAISIMAILPAAVLFIADLADRRDARVAAAWQLVTTKAPGNSGKIQALEYLNSEKLCLPFDLTLPFYGNCWKSRVSLAGVNLSGTEEAPTYLIGINLEGADLEWADMSNTSLEGARFEKALLYGAKFANARLNFAKFDGTILRLANFDEAELIGTSFRSAIIVDSELTNIETAPSIAFEPKYKTTEILKGIDLANIKTDFAGAHLKQINVTGADLRNTAVDEQTITACIWAHSSDPPENRDGIEVTLFDGAGVNRAFQMGDSCVPAVVPLR